MGCGKVRERVVRLLVYPGLFRICDGWTEDIGHRVKGLGRPCSDHL